jgi:hypothetical protein
MITAAEKRLQQETSGGSDNSISGSPVHTAALLARIRFRRALHQLLMQLQDYEYPDLEALQKQCRLAKGHLERIRETAALGEGVEAPGFFPDINRHHMGVAPRRPLKVCLAWTRTAYLRPRHPCSQHAACKRRSTHLSCPPFAPCSCAQL